MLMLGCKGLIIKYSYGYFIKKIHPKLTILLYIKEALVYLDFFIFHYKYIVTNAITMRVMKNVSVNTKIM